MEVHLKVQKARLDAGMNQTAFAKRLGISQNDVWRMENGDKKFVSRAYIDFMIEQEYDLNSLFDCKIDLQKRSNELASKPNANNEEANKINEENLIPLFSDNFMNNFSYYLYHQEEIVPIDYMYAPHSLQNLFQNDSAIRVQCDSMYPILKPNDIIIFNKQPVNFDNILYGEMYLVSVKLGEHEAVLLKRLQHADCDGECVKLVSENPKYQSKDIYIEKIQAMALVKVSIVINSTISWKYNK